jgi:hypothetical protein
VWALLPAALGACGEEHCDASGQNCYYTSGEDSSSDDDDARPCSSLGETECRRSGRCFVDSVCKTPACNGLSCNDSCELVRTCVAY